VLNRNFPDSDTNKTAYQNQHEKNNQIVSTGHRGSARRALLLQRGASPANHQQPLSQWNKHVPAISHADVHGEFGLGRY